jgi:hypothetical protein
MREEADEFTKAAAGVSKVSKTDSRVEKDGWHVRVAFGFPQRDEGLVLRTIAVLVVPIDPNDIPPGGLTQRRLQHLVAGITSDAAADEHVRQEQQAYELDGHPMTPAQFQERRKELRRLGRRRVKGEGRGFGPDFYATVALDAIEEAGKGRRDFIEALVIRYGKSDPRPRDRRTSPVRYHTVRGWVSTARGKDYGFLPATGGRGRQALAPTAALIAHLGGVVMNVEMPMATELETRVIHAKKGK